MLLVAEIMPATSDSVPLIGKTRTPVCLGFPCRCMEEKHVLQGPRDLFCPSVLCCGDVTCYNYYKTPWLIPRPKQEEKDVQICGLPLNWRKAMGDDVPVVSVFMMLRQEDYRIQEFKTSQKNITWAISRGVVHMNVCDRMSLPRVFLPLIFSALESKTSQFEIHYFTWILVGFFFLTKAYILILGPYLLRSLSIHLLNMHLEKRKWSKCFVWVRCFCPGITDRKRKTPYL